jgi:hypothetical protein
MSWITYKVQAQSGATFTHFSRITNPTEAQSEWEEKFNQKAKSIALDDDDTELDFSDLLDE